MAQTAFAVVSCAVPGLSEFYSPVCFSPGVPKLPLAMYPFSNSVDEHVPLNMGAGRIFFRQGPKVDFPGAVVW